MGNQLAQLQDWINILKALDDLSDLIDSIIIIAGGMGGLIIPPRPARENLNYTNAQEWHDAMYSNWQAWAAENPG